ncbi:hypothetical protein EDB81DRAFT_92886 [Dactylonectria macrodidyma]|uniref:Uncharacterized protein n=1 Tax=Dactylonectria macrodidyma TaxID=307937 RepID=A0A9P9ISY7_9HYPO|nr:hypothetical protein EDB81DRAFT_92886 [Dactylonectria macrodidyma]
MQHVVTPSKHPRKATDALRAISAPRRSRCRVGRVGWRLETRRVADHDHASSSWHMKRDSPRAELSLTYANGRSGLAKRSTRPNKKVSTAQGFGSIRVWRGGLVTATPAQSGSGTRLDTGARLHKAHGSGLQCLPDLQRAVSRWIPQLFAVLTVNAASRRSRRQATSCRSSEAERSGLKNKVHGMRTAGRLNNWDTGREQVETKSSFGGPLYFSALAMGSGT